MYVVVYGEGKEMKIKHRLRLWFWRILRPNYFMHRVVNVERGVTFILGERDASPEIVQRLKESYVVGDKKTIDECWESLR